MSHLQFWGKTFGAADQPIENRQKTYKPVLHHLLDVSAVALVFLRDQPARLAGEAQLVSMKPDAYANLMAFLAGLHDLGKFTRNFQAKRADLWPSTRVVPRQFDRGPNSLARNRPDAADGYFERTIPGSLSPTQRIRHVYTCGGRGASWSAASVGRYRQKRK